MSDWTGDLDVYYLDVEDIISIHDDVIEDDEYAEEGLSKRGRGQIEYIVHHVQHKSFSEEEIAIHEMAYDLMRLIAANHPFVDGNKRTALGSAVMFYFFNGYDLSYQEELEAMLILISIREDFIDPEVAAKYLDSVTELTTFGAWIPWLENFAESFEDVRDLEEVEDPYWGPTTEGIYRESDNGGQDDDG